MEVRVCQASAVVVQRVPASAADWFLEWQQGIAQAAESFAGYVGVDLFPPAEGQGDEWVVVIHFKDKDSLQQWLASPVREQWVEKLRSKLGAFEMKILSMGFGPWFAGLNKDTGTVPPSWKMALTVLLGLYPTVMLLTILVGPFTAPLGIAASMLIGNALSVSILQWGVMPVLRRLLGRWLKANNPDKRSISLGGLLALILVLTGLALLFRQVTG